MTELPKVHVVATGGTIAGAAASAFDSTGYSAATTTIDALLVAVPGLESIATLSSEQFAQIDSSNLDDSLLIALSKHVTQLLVSEDVDAVVITHGTDSLEETAYFLHLTVPTTKPIVLVGSMRPATALSADGPRNMFSAVSVAASPDAVGAGVLVVMDDEIHSARDVSKSSSLRLGAFESPYGPLGAVVDGRVFFHRALTRPHTFASEFSLAGITSLPSAAIVFAHSGLEPAMIDALTGVDIIVHAGFGNGTIADRIVPALERAESRGCLVVRATRVENGLVTVVGASDKRANEWVAVDDQNPQRARILAGLALTVSKERGDIQAMFHRY